MCRVVAYLGDPLLLDVLLYQSDSSLVRQVYAPAMLRLLNLAGCGIAAWNHASPRPELPLIYRETKLPMYDRNLMALSKKVETECVLAHIRGSDYSGNSQPQVGPANLHPFLFEGCRIALAHNGGLFRFDEMKFDLLPFIKPNFAAQIQGTTDSEWIYALYMSQLDDPLGSNSAEQMARAVQESLGILRRVRECHGIRIASAINLFISDGSNLVTTRFSFDFGCYAGRITPSNLEYHSLWYTAGCDYGQHDGEWKMAGGLDRPSGILVASEPLTHTTIGWVEVPEYSLMVVSRSDGRVNVSLRDLDV